MANVKHRRSPRQRSGTRREVDSADIGADQVSRLERAAADGDPAHVIFANARTKAELTEFSKRFGPVGRAENQVRFRNALALAALLQAPRHPFAEEIAGLLKRLTDRKLLPLIGQGLAFAREAKSPLASFALEEVAHRVLSQLLDVRVSVVPRSAFMVALTADGDPVGDEETVALWRQRPRSSEVPIAEKGAGILNALYFLLRRDFLIGESRLARRLGICRRTDCGLAFAPGRADAEFCSLACSQVQRQREYYERVGRGRRQRAKLARPRRRGTRSVQGKG